MAPACIENKTRLRLTSCIAGLFMALCIGEWSVQAHASQSTKADVSITMTAGETVITAVLDTSKAATRDFLASLPCTMTMTRWDDREYYGKVKDPLSKAGPRQSAYTDGDVAYFVPGASYAVFFAKGGRSPISNLIVMGRVTSDLNAFDNLGNTVTMHIQVAE